MVKHLKTLLLLFLAFEIKSGPVIELFGNFRSFEALQSKILESKAPEYLNLYEFLEEVRLCPDISEEERNRIISATYDLTSYKFPKAALENPEDVIPKCLMAAYLQHLNSLALSSDHIAELKELSNKYSEVIASFGIILEDRKFIEILSKMQSGLNVLYDLTSDLEQVDFSQYESIVECVIKYFDKNNGFLSPRALVSLKVILENYELLLEYASSENVEKINALKLSEKYRDSQFWNVSSELYTESGGDGIEERNNIKYYLDELKINVVLSALISAFNGENFTPRAITRDKELFGIISFIYADDDVKSSYYSGILNLIRDHFSELYSN